MFSGFCNYKTEMSFATSSLRHKMYCKLVHVGVSARVISPSQPETLMLCRSFYDPPWLQPWCQRNQRSIFIWILSHWNIEWHLGLKSVVSAATSEPADNPTMGAEKLFCLCSLERNIITSNYIRQSFECWNQRILHEPREPISDVVQSESLSSSSNLPTL